MSSATAVDFVHTGPDTVAGRYLRRFWQPVYRVEDLAPGQAVPLQIMSEHFTLYRGETGAPHLVAARCAHRGTQLSTGWVEGDWLRCLYHGWKYDATGQCVEQPGEDAPFAARVRIRSHPTEEYLGLIFAYLGEGEPPPFRRFPDFELPGVVEAGPPEYWPCNYFNRVDNACDGAHVAFTHRESTGRTGKTSQYALPAMSFAETDYGIRTTVQVPGRPPYYFHFHMPNINQARSQSRVEGSLEDARNLWVDRLFWRVPVDDERSVSFVVDYLPLTGPAAEAYRQRRRQAQQAASLDPNRLAEAVLAGRMRIAEIDREASIYKLFWVEDYCVQVGQGTVADRAHERLGRVDAGVILLRQLWRRELQALAEGRPLKAWTSPAGLSAQTAI
jgi:5,5'-dehydrodivanillate O-demethylase oxygenase subunit